MTTEQQRKQAIARARVALEKEREGALPAGTSDIDAAAFWRGWLRQALTTLLQDLERSEEGGQQ